MIPSTIWPAAAMPLSQAKQTKLLNLLQPLFGAQLAMNQLPPSLTPELPRLYLPLAAWLNHRRQKGKPLLVGLNGSQGSGKSSLCNLLKWILEAAFDCSSCILSIDDLYLPQAARKQLATEVHPLLATRGVPGTHDIQLGLELFTQLKGATAGETINLPRFNKATDDRFPAAGWDQVETPIDIILFEGWCVGATPEPEAALVEPINQLEEKEDPGQEWRRYVNAQLRDNYQLLFEQLDLLMMLKTPAWEMVYHWRRHQEEQLAGKQGGSGIMGDVALQRFIMHYERLTRHQLQSLPEKADLVLLLNSQQQVSSVKLN